MAAAVIKSCKFATFRHVNSVLLEFYIKQELSYRQQIARSPLTQCWRYRAACDYPSLLLAVIIVDLTMFKIAIVGRIKFSKFSV